MADERQPAGGGFGRIESALQRLERRIEQVAQEVDAQARRGARQAPETRVGLPDAATQRRRITQEATEVEGNTKAWERNAAARQEANRAARAGERRTAGGLIVPQGADSGRVAAGDAGAIARVNAQNAAAQAKAAEYAQLQQRVGAIRERAASTIGLESSALQRQIQIYGSSSQALRKHGALTTEFISEAARGNVTFSEMRYQVGATIGKFAGWTAAAAAVYGVLGAVAALGKGAIDSSNGVNQLQRVIDHVDSGRAQAGFRGLSRRFNLPIEDVASAQYELGKRFGDQNEALAATPALLYAVKVGELNVADASRFLIATTNAYGLEVNQLTPLLDQFNSLQNNMGVSIRDTAAGVAKASGQWRAAGGDLEQLVAIVGAGTRVTGLSGEQFGTLLQRSAGLINRPKNQEILRGLGIDPTQSISQIYEQAFRIAPTLARRNLVHLAEGLSTPQLAPRLTALLGRPDIYREALRNVDPSVARGSSQRELNQQLGSISERAKRLVTDFQQLGSVLSSTGAWVVPGAFLTGLDHSLRLVTSLGEGIAGLPAPLNQAIVPLLILVGALKLARRFNLGDSLAARSSPELARLFNQSPERRARGLVQTGLGRELQFFQDERERVARQAAVASRRTVGQRDRLDRVLAATPQNAPAAQLREVERQQAAFNAARRVERELIEEEALLSQQIASTEARNNAFRANVVKGRQTALEFARAEGIYLPATVAAPTTRRPFRPGVDRTRAIGGTAQNVEARLGAAIAGRNASLLFADRQRVFNTLVEASGREIGNVERAALTGAQKTVAAGSAIGRGASAMRGLGTGILRLGGGLLAALGPIDILLIGLIALPAVIDQVKQRLERDHDELDAARQRAQSTAPRSTQALRQAAVDAGRRSHEQGHDFFANFGYPGLLYEEYATGSTVGARRRDAERGNEALFNRIASGQDRARTAGRPVPGRTIADITTDRNRVIAQARSGQIGVREARKRIAQLLDEYGKSYEKIVAAGSDDTGEQKRVADRIKRVQGDTRRGTAGLRARGGGRDLYAGLDLQGIQKDMQAYEQLAAAGVRPAANLRNAASGLRALKRQVDRDPTPQNLALLAQARDQYEQAVQQYAQKELDSALLFARTPAQRASAFQDYQQRLRAGLLRQPHQATAQAAGRVRGDGRAIERATRDRQEALKTLDDPNAGFFDKLQAGLTVASRTQQIDRLLNRAKRDAHAFRKAGQDQKEQERKFREFQQQAREQRFQLDEAQRNAFTDLAVSRTGNPFERLRIQIQAQGVNVAEAITVFGRGSTEVATEMQKQEDLLNQQAEQNLQLSVLQVQGRYAGATNPRTQIQGQIAAIDAELAGRRGNRRLDDPTKIQELLNRRKELQSQIAQQAIQDARALIEAQYAYRESRTEDPIRIARLELQKAERLISLAQTKPERLQARANRNIARRGLLQTRQQESYDEIQFLFDIGKITQEQQVARLKGLLKTIHGNRALRRQILRDLHSIKEGKSDGSDLEIDLDSLRLPTPYEVRRMLRGGRTRGHTVTVAQSNTVNVTVRRGQDAHKVAEAIDDVLNTSTASALRTAGLGG